MNKQQVEALYHRFDKPDRLLIRRHYEGEEYRSNLQMDEIYKQGLRDCFQLCAFLSERTEPI